MQVFLKKHGQGPAVHSIKISWKRDGRKIVIDFTVQKRNASFWEADPAMTDDYQKNWGLWNKDVVEAFLQLRSRPDEKSAPYLEIQDSPLNRPFALIITEPRKTFYAPQKLEFKTTSSTEGRLWTGSLEVFLPADLKGDLLYGGFFSCLTHDPREFYALEPNPEVNPDFHRPELFVSLDME